LASASTASSHVLGTPPGLGQLGLIGEVNDPFRYRKPFEKAAELNQVVDREQLMFAQGVAENEWMPVTVRAKVCVFVGREDVLGPRQVLWR
jgi:hypothetical protein